MDEIDGNCKSIIRRKTFSQGKDRIIVQNAKEFADAVTKYVHSVQVAYISQEAITKINEEKPFTNITLLPRITKSHMIQVCQQTTKLS